MPAARLRRKARASGLLREVAAAWYEREFSVPAEWADRRIGIEFEYLNSYARVYLAGAEVAEVRFPGGDADLTTRCRPGSTRRFKNAR